MPKTNILDIASEVVEELRKAQAGNCGFNSMHEGYAVILEEMDELKTEVWKNGRKHPERMALARQEAIQVAAMAIRFVYDLTEKS